MRRHPRLFTSFIAQHKLSASACSGVSVCGPLHRPLNTFTSCSNKTKPIPIPSLASTHDASTWHLHWCVRLGAGEGFLLWLFSSSFVKVVSTICAIFQASASCLASCKISKAVVSKLLKHLLFRAFHWYHMIHGNIEEMSPIWLGSLQYLSKRRYGLINNQNNTFVWLLKL